MPELLAGGEKLFDVCIPVSVGIANESDFGHTQYVGKGYDLREEVGIY